MRPKGSPRVAERRRFTSARRPPRPPRRGALPRHYPAETRLYREASVDTHITPDDPPFLLVHGDNDRAVSFEHSVIMEKKLKEAGVPVKFIKMPGGGHGGSISAGPNPADYIAAMIEWFDTHLRK